MRIDRIGAAALEDCLPGLAALLVDAVESGAGVSFMHPLDRADAEAFWRGLRPELAADRRILLAAFDPGGVAGTVQLACAPQPNQRHRADVAKLLVHRRARGRGLGRALMLALEAEARRIGRTLLTLDTAFGTPAERLYRSLGYCRAGIIPFYALMPNGEPTATVIFYKHLQPGSEAPHRCVEQP